MKTRAIACRTPARLLRCENVTFSVIHVHVIHNHIQSNKPSLITCALDQSESTSHIWEARWGFDKLSREFSQTELPGGYIQAVHMRLHLHWKPVVSLRWVKPFRNHCGDQNWNRLLKQGEKWTKSHIMNLWLTSFYGCVQERTCLCFIRTQLAQKAWSV